MFINTRRIAKDTVNRALSNQFYTKMNRFDVTSPKKLQGKGLFNAICQAFKAHPETLSLKIYIQCVQNKSWLEHLRNSPDWVETNPCDFISTK